MNKVKWRTVSKRKKDFHLDLRKIKVLLINRIKILRLLEVGIAAMQRLERDGIERKQRV